MGRDINAQMEQTALTLAFFQVRNTTIRLGINAFISKSATGTGTVLKGHPHDIRV
jgi:hypothetical protein